MIEEAKQYEVPQEKIDDALGEHDTLLDETRGFRPESAEDGKRLASALKTTLMAVPASIGECQEAVPYATVRPVRDPDGNFKWCCNHDPECARCRSFENPLLRLWTVRVRAE